MDKRVRIRDGNSLNPAREFRVHDGAVTAAAWHPRIPILATASDDHSVRLWNVHTGQQLEEFAVLEWVPDRLFWDSSGERLAVMCRELSATMNIFRPACVQPAAQVPPQK
jgi:WD40 repeat protein